jgi:hypothetical protein
MKNRDKYRVTSNKRKKLIAETEQRQEYELTTCLLLILRLRLFLNAFAETYLRRSIPVTCRKLLRQATKRRAQNALMDKWESEKIKENGENKNCALLSKQFSVGNLRKLGISICVIHMMCEQHVVYTFK